MNGKMLYAVLVAAVLFIGGTARAGNYSLAGDWSDTANPNGTWSLNSGSMVMTEYNSYPGGNNTWNFNGSTNPSWNKVTTAEDGHAWLDRQAGDVIAQAAWYSSDRTNVTWTSPASGTITITGRSWDALGDLYEGARDGDWALELNGVAIAERSSIYGLTRNAEGATFAENLPWAISTLPLAMCLCFLSVDSLPRVLRWGSHSQWLLSPVALSCWSGSF
jgi:hypothetical protein